jgi:hypothetical protein
LAIASCFFLTITERAEGEIGQILGDVPSKQEKAISSYLIRQSCILHALRRGWQLGRGIKRMRRLFAVDEKRVPHNPETPT